MELAYKVEEDKVSIVMPERINESNAEGFKNQMVSIQRLHSDIKPEVDCTDLKYISSSGLRVLLTAQKKWGKDKITLKNVRKEVNEILEMTGFDDIFHVTRPLKKVELGDCVKIGDGINGTLYRLSKGLMVKVFRKDIPFEEVEKEINMAKKALVLGVPTPISFTIVNCGEGFGILYEEIEPVSVAQKIKEDPMKLGFYVLKYADFVKELHNTEVLPGQLPSIKSRYMEWLEEAGKEIEPSKVIGMKEMVNRIEDKHSFVHGDMTIDHVYLVGSELMVMDLGSCGYGHPIFDLQAIYASLVAIEIDHPGYCKETLGISAANGRQIWKLFIKRYLNHGAEEQPEESREGSLNQLLESYYILKETLLDSLARRQGIMS